MLDYFKRSEFTRNIFILISGSSIAQVIPLLAEPVVSRIFQPEEFGVYEVYVAIVMLLGVIATARYEMAIVLPRTENKAVNILGLSLFFVLLITAIALLLILVARSWVLSLIPAEGFGTFVLYVPLGILLFGINRSLQYWMVRREQMKSISLARISESSTKAGGSILFGIMKLSSLGLIWGQIAGQLASAVIMVWQFIAKDRRKIRFLNGGGMKRMARRYVEFPVINVPIALSETFQVSGLIFIISFFFDNGTVGEFSKALRILIIPLYLIGSSINQVFYQRASRDYNRGVDFSYQLKRIITNLMKWSVVPLIVFAAISPWLFGFVLGKQWVTAGEHARILVVWIFIKFITGPITIVPMIIDRQKVYLLWNFIGNLVMIAAVVVPAATGSGITYTLAALSISMAVFSVMLYFRMLAVYKRSLQG